MTLEIDFVHRVYRTTGVLAVLLGAMIWERFGPKAALGWLLGAVLSLAAVAVLEWSVCTFFRPGQHSAGKLLAVSLGKMLVMFGALVLAYVAATHKWLSLLWVLPGFALPHLVIVLKLVGRWVSLAQASAPEGSKR